MNDIEATSYVDNKQFISRLEEFNQIHEDINEITSDTTLSPYLENCNYGRFQPVARYRDGTISGYKILNSII